MPCTIRVVIYLLQSKSAILLKIFKKLHQKKYMIDGNGFADKKKPLIKY